MMKARFLAPQPRRCPAHGSRSFSSINKCAIPLGGGTSGGGGGGDTGCVGV